MMIDKEQTPIVHAQEAYFHQYIPIINSNSEHAPSTHTYPITNHYASVILPSYQQSKSLPSISSSRPIKKTCTGRFNAAPPSYKFNKFVVFLDNNHKREQSDEFLKKYVCSTCGKNFVRPSSLTTHTYSHTGEKPFKCAVEGCGRRFSVISNLRRHGKVHTVESTPPPPAS